MHSKGSIGLLIAATAVFSEFFILVFSPFESRTWVNNDWQYLGWSALMVMTAALVMFVSRILMRTFARKYEVSYGAFVAWIIIEILAMTTIYCLVLILCFPEFTEVRDISFMHLFKEVSIGIVFILLIPYTIIFLVLELREKNLLLQQAQGNIAFKQSMPAMFNFYDDRGELKLAVRPDMIYYLEGADNYVMIYYMSGQKLEKLMIRNTLKNVAWSFREQGLIRCSRSYIVNIAKVQMLRKVDGEVVLDFGDPKLPTIPVSQTYTNDVIAKMGVQ